MTAVFGPGSASDTICRIIADPLSGAQSAGRGRRSSRRRRCGGRAIRPSSAADGYKLLMATNSPLSADPFLHKVSYDPVKDFAPVTRVAVHVMLVVNPKLPIHSVKELVDYAKANPGKLSFASGNTAGIVGSKTLAHLAGLDILHVPYKITPPAIEDMIGGRVSMMIVDFTVAMPHVAAGTLRPLAVTRLKRGRYFRICRPWMKPASRASISMPGPAWSRRPTRRPRSSPSLTARCARSSTARTPRRSSRMSASRVFLDAGRVGRFHQGPARQVAEDGQGRQDPVGLRTFPPRESGEGA